MKKNTYVRTGYLQVGANYFLRLPRGLAFVPSALPSPTPSVPSNSLVLAAPAYPFPSILSIPLKTQAFPL